MNSSSSVRTSSALFAAGAVALLAFAFGCSSEREQRARPSSAGSGPVAGNASSSAGATAAGGGASSAGGSSGTGPEIGAGLGGSAGVAGDLGASGAAGGEPSPRTRRLLSDGWRFKKGDPSGATGLAYSSAKPWVLPTGNAFVKDAARYAKRPSGNLGDGLSYVTPSFDDTSWQSVNLPHDYAIEGPFTNSVSSS